MNLPHPEPFLTAVEGGADYRTAWEEYLAALEPEGAQRAEWAVREALATAALYAAEPRRVLVVGSGFLGTAPALAQLGCSVVLVDPDETGARFARARALAVGGDLRVERATSLPEGPFDLVVLPDAPHGLAPPLESSIAQAARAARPEGGQVLLMATNRLAYKRTTGLHGRFDRPGPIGFLARALRGAGGERTLAGYAALLERAGLRVVRRLVPYVSHLDYAYVANADVSQPPFLEVGRRERRNGLKLAAYRCGLFPWLAPSCALIAERPGAPPRPAWIEAAAAAAAQETGGPARVERLLATRGNAAIALTKGLVLRIPLCAKEVRLGRMHFEASDRFRAALGDVLPRPLGELRLGGLHAYVEERRPGVNSSQHTGAPRLRARTLLDLAGLLAKLAPAPLHLDAAALEEVVGARVRLVASRLRDRPAIDAVGRLGARVTEMLAGKTIPLPACHGDLRAKHVLVADDGRVTGLLDWGTWRAPNLPLFDLLHFLLQDRREEYAEPLERAAIGALHPRALRDFEEAAFRLYCERLGLDDDARRACELFYPVEVGTTAFLNWDFDRPRWVERNFGELLRLS